MTKPAQLDPKIATRSVDFSEALRVLDLSDQKSQTYTNLLRLAESQNIIADQFGQSLKKSSFHRNWKTLEVLGLIRKTEQFHRPTLLGQNVLIAFRKEDFKLGDQTKYLLRHAMLNSDIAKQNFFSLFATEKTREPLGYTAAIALVPASKALHPEAKDRGYRIQNLVTGFVYDLTNRQVQGIVWGLGSWAMNLGLADQLYARPQDGVNPELSKIAFLVNPDRKPDQITSEFTDELEMLIERQDPEYGITVRLPISRLFYQICPVLQITASTARQELIKWLNLNKNRAFVEGASQPVIKNIRKTNRSGSRISWKDQSPALLEIDGRYYTYLFCQKLKKAV
jgi:hypothetical protein